MGTAAGHGNTDHRPAPVAGAGPELQESPESPGLTPEREAEATNGSLVG